MHSKENMVNSTIMRDLPLEIKDSLLEIKESFLKMKDSVPEIRIFYQQII